MTQEEKQLLFKDLCARLPYGVKLGFENSDLILVPTDFNIYTMQLSTNQIYPKSNSVAIGRIYDIWSYRPYLRPMLSMTDEEKKQYRKTQDKISVQWDDCGQSIGYIYANTIKTYDWLNKNHFDYRNLIKKSLAIIAPEGMYKNE